MLGFKLPNASLDQLLQLPVLGAPLVLRNIAELFQQLRVHAERKTGLVIRHAANLRDEVLTKV